MRKYPDALHRLTKLIFVPRVLIFILCCGLFPLFLPSLLLAQERVNTKLQTAKPQALIGDPVTVEIEIEHPVANSYELKAGKKSTDFFELRETPTVTTERIDGQLAKTKISLSLIPFQTGKLPIPPFIITRNDGQELVSQPLELEVTPIVGKDENSIKDFRLLPRSAKNGWLQTALLITFMAATGIYLMARFSNLLINRALAMFWAGRAQPQVATSPLIVSQTLEEEFIVKLRKLIASKQADRDIKQFYVQLAEIITGYAVTRYGVLGREYTTTDLMDLFSRKAVPVLVVSTYDKILTDCDLAKFARESFTVEIAEKSAQQAIDLLKALSYESQIKTSTTSTSTTTTKEAKKEAAKGESAL